MGKMKIIETWNEREWIEVKGELPIGMYMVRVREVIEINIPKEISNLVDYKMQLPVRGDKL